jgi:hypothetical protein
MNIAILALLGALSVAPRGQQNGVVIGALEQPQCKDDPAIAVRALFQKRGQEWVALSTEEDSQGVALGKTTWTVAFDGRSLGTITTVDPGFQTDFAWTYSRDRLLHVPPGQTVPRVVDNRAAFYGWCAAPKRGHWLSYRVTRLRTPMGGSLFGLPPVSVQVSSRASRNTPDQP